MFKNKNTRGFTLIELLVVIAIIGVLSSIVIASLNTARNRGADTAVKANLSGIKAQAEIYYDTNGNYGLNISSCVAVNSMFKDANITNALGQALENSASGATQACSTDTSGLKWATSVSALRGGGSWCIDSTGWNHSGAASDGVCSE
ncbi:MAG TPA: type II secretion system protein [Candidatus Paceibacterota bacterium]